MGGLCGCSRGNRYSEQNTEKRKDDATKSMLSDDGNSLNVGGTKKDGDVTFATLNTSNKHKEVNRVQKSKISGMDDTGHEHIDNGYDSGDDNDNDDATHDEREIINNQTEINDPIYLSSNSETLVVKNGGFSMTNGEYRWFLHEQKWCYFTETGTNYSIRKNVKVSNVYKQLEALQSKNASFKWNKDIQRCWIISDMDASHIYYAAPMEYSDKIPSNFGWISVHGSEPGPVITQNKSHDSQGPDDDEDSLTFANSSVSSLIGRRPSSKVSNIGTLAEEDTLNIQETPRSNTESDEDDDDESEVSQMSD